MITCCELVLGGYQINPFVISRVRGLVPWGISWHKIDNQFIAAETKWPPFSQTTFSTALHSVQNLNFDRKFIGVCSYGSNWRYASIVLEAGHRRGDKLLSELTIHICFTRRDVFLINERRNSIRTYAICRSRNISFRWVMFWNHMTNKKNNI